MQLGIEVPAGVVPEGRHHEAVTLHPGAVCWSQDPSPGTCQGPSRTSLDVTSIERIRSMAPGRFHNRDDRSIDRTEH